MACIIIYWTVLLVLTQDCKITSAAVYQNQNIKTGNHMTQLREIRKRSLTMSLKPTPLRETQESYEQRFVGYFFMRRFVPVLGRQIQGKEKKKTIIHNNEVEIVSKYNLQVPWHHF